MLREAVGKLIAGKTLSREEAAAAMAEILRGEATPAQIGAFIAATRLTGITPELVAGCAEVMRANATPVTCRDPNAVDIVGTGGDGAHTFNISTTAAFVAAGAGATVAKHGSYGVSSKCGSADVLAELGIDIRYSPERMAACLEKTGIAFLFAPSLHPAMKHAVGPRRDLGVWSIFNILGPLCNPAGVHRGVLGVFDEALMSIVADASLQLGADRLFIVHGEDGLDEFTLTAPTRVIELRNGETRAYTVTPESLGLQRARPEQLTGGEPEENARITRAVLAGEERGPRRDVVLLNAAFALIAAGAAQDAAEGIELAARSIDSGAAAERLEALAACSRGE